MKIGRPYWWYIVKAPLLIGCDLFITWEFHRPDHFQATQPYSQSCKKHLCYLLKMCKPTPSEKFTYALITAFTGVLTEQYLCDPPRCYPVIQYAVYSSVWIMVAHLLHNHWYGINGHTNQGQWVLSGSTPCPSVILAFGGRQPQPFPGVASSIKSLWHVGGMLQELECIQFQRITLKIYSKKCLLANICVNLQGKSAEFSCCLLDISY